MNILIMLRHGQSAWNLEGKFTGWIDVPLTSRGEKEARNAGVEMRSAGLNFDIAFVSVLQRAIKTLEIALNELSPIDLPIRRDWRLNERHYGMLQGLNKKETTELHGKDKVHKWRRSYSQRPPQMPSDHTNHPAQNPLYKNITQLPSGESLADTLNRVQEFWHELVVPVLLENKSVLIVAHGNSLRALAKLIENMSEEDISEFNIPTGVPIVYEMDAKLNLIDRYFLADKKKIEAAIQEVVQQA